MALALGSFTGYTTYQGAGSGQAQSAREWLLPEVSLCLISICEKSKRFCATSRVLSLVKTWGSASARSSALPLVVPAAPASHGPLISNYQSP